MTTIIDRTMPIVAFGIMLTSIPAHAVILPVPGNYIDQTGACMSVTARNTAERTFTLSSGDVCKPGVTVLEGSESEEKTFRCVAQLNEGALAGYWGRLLSDSFSIQGDSRFTMDETWLLRTQQSTRFEETLTFTPDTTGACSGSLSSAAGRGR